MRICSPQLGLAPNSVLGGEVFDREILLGLAKKGIKVEIILPIDKPHDKNIKNWRITFLPISSFPAILGNFLVVPYLFKVYKKSPFSIIRVHQPQFLGLGCLSFKIFNPKVRLVVTYHQFRESNFWLFSKIINNVWDSIICDSENVKKRIIEQYKISQNKIMVVHNGVPSYLKPAAKDRELLKKLKLEGKIILLFMGLFEERKNPLFLLDVLICLNKAAPNLVLIFWGKGPLKSAIVSKAKNLGISDKVRILGPIYGKDKNKIHNLADIFVHSSLDEGFALAPLEAMACGKPIVTTDFPGYRLIVKNAINGFLVPEKNINQISQALIKLVNSPKLRVKMGKMSRQLVLEHFSWSSVGKSYANLFGKLV